ncbi:DRTGG domain-containing protein, partial [Staphylococcus epidermidis]|uniref:DRTGG domain-containing protein n=1 Tax=Staphylococcus epidermidis TaxID=1282 RepID=UPI0037D9D1C1
MVQAQILPPTPRLNKSLSKFPIPPIQFHHILKYIPKHTLLILPNTQNLHIQPLKPQTSILITPPFPPTAQIIPYPHHHQLPIISSTYHTFLLPNIINKPI